MFPQTNHPRGRPTRSRFGPIVGSLVAVLLVAACSTNGATDDNDLDEPDATGQGEAAAGADDASGGSGDPLLDFYQCLRDNGLDVADPGQGDAIGLGDLDMDDPAISATVEGCGEVHLSASDGRVTVGEGRMGDNLAEPDALIAFVDCLRDHGVEMQDPSPDGRLTMPENLDPNSSEFQNAAQECAQYLDGGGLLMGDGSGGGTAGRRP